MKILYAGDSPVGGPANYLLGILHSLKADCLHLAPTEVLKPSLLKKHFDLILLSDFSRKQTPDISQRLIAGQVMSGCGFLMVGGWGSFSGPFGGWHHSILEDILPVNCLGRDDRLNFPQGALMSVTQPHSMFRSLAFDHPPVICGMNLIQPKKTAKVLLGVRKITTKGSNFRQKLRAALDSKTYPLLAIHEAPRVRTAAFAADFAPHWCGGFVDWGNKTLKLPVNQQIRIEVGNYYVSFVSCLIQWLAGRQK